MWKRAVTVTITSEDGSINMKFGGHYYEGQNYSTHRIDFEYHTKVGWGDTFGTITLYNLSNEEIKTLQRREFGVMNIELSAGYVDNTGQLNADGDKKNTLSSTIFTGTITNVINYKQIPDNITHLYCVPHIITLASKIPDGGWFLATEPGMTMLDVFKNMCGAVGLGWAHYGVSDETLQYTFLKTVRSAGSLKDNLEVFCKRFSLTYVITPTFVVIYPLNMGELDIISKIVQGNPPAIITPGMVIGNPVAGVATFELSTLLNAEFLPGQIIDVTKLISPNSENSSMEGGDAVGGVVSYNMGHLLAHDATTILTAVTNFYQIEALVHRGSTHASIWQTDLSGKCETTDAMGANERNWRSWCINAYGSTGEEVYI